MNQKSRISLLFVCMGNICRSPMAEGHFRKVLARHARHLDVHVDSAGTHGFHIGSPPDQRAQAAARRRGIDISGLTARSVIDADFERFDLILAMDRDNREELLAMADPACHDRIRLLLDFSRNHAGADVPDPYYGGKLGFERVLDLIEDAADGLLEEVRQSVAGKVEAGR